MKSITLIVPFLVAVTTVLCGCAVLYVADPCRCLPSYPWIQYRYDAKNEKEFARYPRSVDTINVDRVIQWQHTYQSLRGVLDPRTHRLESTPEDTVYTLLGRLHYVRQMLDCDFHMEIGSMDTTDTRFIVCELPVNNCYHQRWIKKMLEERGYSMRQYFPGGLPILITGLGFWDGQHGLKKNGLRASQWEIHPVEKIAFP